jgi:hypothetical protein
MSKAKRITGCGILFIYKTQEDRYRVLLIKEKRGIYNDIGGGKDNGEKEVDTVKRETQEESRGLFNIDSVANELEYIDIEKENGKYYRSYCVMLDITDDDIAKITEKYIENMNIIDADTEKKYKTTWKETINIHDFDVDTLLKGYGGKRVKYVDNEKNFYLVGDRPTNALFAIFNDADMVNRISSKIFNIKYENNSVKNGIKVEKENQ